MEEVFVHGDDSQSFSLFFCKHQSDIALGYELLSEAAHAVLNLKCNILCQPALAVEYLHLVVGR